MATVMNLQSAFTTLVLATIDSFATCSGSAGAASTTTTATTEVTAATQAIPMNANQPVQQHTRPPSSDGEQRQVRAVTTATSSSTTLAPAQTDAIGCENDGDKRRSNLCADKGNGPVNNKGAPTADIKHVKPKPQHRHHKMGGVTNLNTDNENGGIGGHRADNGDGDTRRQNHNLVKHTTRQPQIHREKCLRRPHTPSKSCNMARTPMSTLPSAAIRNTEAAAVMAKRRSGKSTDN